LGGGKPLAGVLLFFVEYQNARNFKVSKPVEQMITETIISSLNSVYHDIIKANFYFEAIV
jgi:hypothetical protein